jgi:hypothetical protein
VCHIVLEAFSVSKNSAAVMQWVHTVERPYPNTDVK